MVARMTGKRLLAVVAVLVFGCVAPGPDVAHYKAVLDELAIPADWELVHTTLMTPDTEPGCSTFMGDCPSVTRYYLVDGEPKGAYAVAKQVALDTGFEIDQEIAPDCHLPPSGAACVFNAGRGSEMIRVNLYNPGEDLAGLGIAEPDRSLVLITAVGK